MMSCLMYSPVTYRVTDVGLCTCAHYTGMDGGGSVFGADQAGWWMISPGIELFDSGLDYDPRWLTTQELEL